MDDRNYRKNNVILEIKGIGVTFDGFHALTDVNSVC